MRWTGGAEDDGEPLVTDEFDQEAAAQHRPGPRRRPAGDAEATPSDDDGAATDHRSRRAETGPAGTASPTLELKPALEAVLMVVDEPATEEHLAKVLDRPRRAVADALRELADEYTAQGRGFELRLVAGGWRFYTRPEYAEAVEASSWTASRPGSPRPRWRPSRWSRTASRSAGPGSPPCAASTATA